MCCVTAEQNDMSMVVMNDNSVQATQGNRTDSNAVDTVYMMKARLKFILLTKYI